MKFKFLLVTFLVVLGAGSASHLSGSVRYTLENKMTKRIFIGYCVDQKGCFGTWFGPNGVSNDIYASPWALLVVYWSENLPYGNLIGREPYPHDHALKLYNTEFTKFTVNPDGSIVGSK